MSRLKLKRWLTDYKQACIDVDYGVANEYPPEEIDERFREMDDIEEKILNTYEPEENK